MTSFKIAHSDAGDWSRIAKTLAEDLAGDDGFAAPSGEDLLGFLYVTDSLADDIGSVITYLRQTTGIDDWTGSIGLGVCATGVEYFDRPAAVAMLASLEKDSFFVFPAITDDIEDFPAEGKAWADEVSAPFGIVHGDPNNPNVGLIIEALGLVTNGFMVGGLSASRGVHAQIAGGITDGGVSGVLFAPSVEVATGLTQGCVPVGPVHVVSDSLVNVIIGLDGNSALDVFKDDVGELLSRDLTRAAGYIHAAFPIEGSDTGDFVVRNLTGIDPERGWLAVGEDIHAGERVMFVRRDPNSAEADLKAMIEGIKGRLPGPPRGGVYFSCIARGPAMFGEEGKEMS